MTLSKLRACAVLLVLLATGCHITMNATSAAKAPNVFPLSFKEHAIEAHCYNTLGCRVRYADRNLTLGQDATPSAAPPAGDYRSRWGFASDLGIRNFPPPAELSWTSLDGTAHQTRVDIGEIFKDERVLHHVRQEDYPDGSFGGSPSIFIEINDRTVRVFMKAFVATRTPQIPGRTDAAAHGRADLIEAWSRTY